MQQKKKKDTIIYAIQFFLVAILIILVLLMVSRIESIQGKSRVVNYAGIVRGSVQRLVKLELSHYPDDKLIVYIESILDNLETGIGDYQLDKLTDSLYLQKLSLLSSAWEELKREIVRFRMNGTELAVLLKMSEDFFVLADDTVRAAENYAEGEARQLIFLEAALILIIALILLLIARQIASLLLMNKTNRELNLAAYIDANTGLPNKARCHQVMNDISCVPFRHYACVVFDLNNLKQTNDTYGHHAGDALIYNFAGILLGTASDTIFVGRYGGDEFIAILSDTSEDELTSFLRNIETKVAYYNSSAAIPISVAHGDELAAADENFSMTALLMKADEKMYRNKAQMKSKPSGV